MKRINFDEKISAFNKCRIENQNKTFFYQELLNLLHTIGINRGIGVSIIKHGYVNKEKIGNKNIYSFSSTPLHIEQLRSLYKELSSYKCQQYKKSTGINFENEAISLLQGKGYQIRKLVGFDEQKFAKENPTLYAKYLVYELV